MSCAETFAGYALRSIGIGERRLPLEGITFCDQVVLIGSGLIWNIYFAVLALLAGFVFATVLALMKASSSALLRKPAEFFIMVFRGSPLFIQFFFGYFLLLTLKQNGWVPDFMTNVWAGGLLVLFFNTSAYSGQIFYGALRAIPKGEVEAADAYGFAGFRRFRRIVWPTMLRLAWPAYTNEAIFLFHATALVFIASAFPIWQQRGDALYYADYFASKTFNPFPPYGILAVYFIILSLFLIWLFGRIGQRLNRHLPGAAPKRPRLFGQLIR